MATALSDAYYLAREDQKPAFVVWVAETPHHDPEKGYVCGHYEATTTPNRPNVQYVAKVENLAT